MGIQNSWVHVWGDDFVRVNGSGPDTTKWNFDIGAGGWGNNELQYYTNRTNNAYIENNQLVIQANREDYGGAPYTSARLLTSGKYEIKYGKIEMKAKLPYGQGIWPAFWMLGNNIGSAKWPNCGEIDIMEFVGKTPNTVYGTIHGPEYWGAGGISTAYQNAQGFSNSYHTYTVEFEPGVLKWYVDGNWYKTATPADLNGKEWVFDHPFFILINLAVGGDWPGYPDGSTVFPQKYYIDFINVYQRAGGYNIVALKSAANSSYVTAENCGSSPLIANRTTPGLWEYFEKIDLGSEKIALRSLTNSKYVCADTNQGGLLIANRDSVSTWETFQIVNLSDGKKALQALSNNKYVCAENEGKNALVASKDAVGGSWEAFDLVSQSI